MTITQEVIAEAARLIIEHPADLKVLKAQKRIFNEYVNVLIAFAKEREGK